MKGNNIFTRVPVQRPKRNVFDLSFENRFSCKMGDLIPFLCKPVVPGDTFKVNSEIFIRTAPLVSPMFQKINVYTHYFYVPNRLLMEKWEQFISPHPTKSNPEPTELQLPALSGLINPSNADGPGIPLSIFGSGVKKISPDLLIGNLFDFLGYKFQDASLGSNMLLQSILPINAYNLIYQCYYQDQNVGVAKTIDDPVLLDQDEIVDLDFDSTAKAYEAASGEPISSYFNLRRRCWKKDYFTSALPFTQRGEDVHVPLYGSAHLVPSSQGFITTENSGTWGTPAGSPSPAGDFDLKVRNSPGSNAYTTLINSGSQSHLLSHNHGVLGEEIAKAVDVDLSTVTAATVNELRRAVQLQKYLEISARVGGRYKEFVFGHFGVDINDGRLQRPEYLGGGVSPLKIGDVFQTSSTVTSGQDTYALGDLAGRGMSYGNQQGFKHTFPEHGYVIGIMSLQPEAAYYQGVPRDLLKMDRLDFFTPEFAHLGEQPIFDSELFVDITKSSDKLMNTFGYTPRYSEYKNSLGEIHGTFKSSLDTWHDARKFAEQPTLSQLFLQVNEHYDGLNRVFAVPGTEENPVEHFYCYVQHHIKALRPMPVFGIPQF